MKKHGVPLYNLAAEDIADGKVPMVLGLMWSVARYSQIEKGLAPLSKDSRKLTPDSADPDNPQSTVGLELQKQNSDRSIQTDKEDEFVKSALLDFVSKRTEAPVTNFSSDFQDGTKLSALVYSFDPILHSLAPESVEHLPPLQRAESAITLAENRLNIPRLFEPSELAEGTVDPRSMMLYISLFQNLSADIERDAEIERQHQESIKAEETRKQLEKAQIEEKVEDPSAYVSIPIPPQTERIEPQAPQFGQSMSFPEMINLPHQTFESTSPIPPPEGWNPIPPASAPGRPPSESFPNPPIGGTYANGFYMTSTGVQYDPASAAEIEEEYKSTTHRYGRKPTSFFGKVKAFGQRVVLEVDHELDKGVSVLTSNVGEAQKRFRNFFQFKYPEPLYQEFPCKFASSGQNMMIGFMYLTKNYLCFTGELEKQRLCVILALADIESVEKGATTFLQRYKNLPKIVRWDPSMHLNALLVSDRFGKVHRFFSFVNPWEAYEMVDNVWGDFKERKSSAISGPPLPPKPPVPLQRRSTYPPLPPKDNPPVPHHHFSLQPQFIHPAYQPQSSNPPVLWAFPTPPIPMNLTPMVSPFPPPNIDESRKP